MDAKLHHKDDPKIDANSMPISLGTKSKQHTKSDIVGAIVAPFGCQKDTHCEVFKEKHHCVKLMPLSAIIIVSEDPGIPKSI